MSDAEGLLLLTALTISSPDLQKLVAFENAFDRVFTIIESEGSLTQGGVVVQDCLSLLANLLRLNASNQSFFREIGGGSQVAAILDQALREEDSPDGVADWAASQRDKNLWGLLSVVRLFLSTGSAGTQVSQATFWQTRVTPLILDIAFHPSMHTTIRAEVRHGYTENQYIIMLIVRLRHWQLVPISLEEIAVCKKNLRTMMSFRY